MDRSLSCRSGGIAVATTERGLPIALKLDQRELSKPPAQLARDILLLCQVSARHMQVARRRDLVARGVDPNVIRGLDLSTSQALAEVEAELRGADPEGMPDTWMTRI
ncbi:hypothetical protein [Mycobacterium sherrisii]|uniref:DUF2694 domain-containing protein n=1 Tax=Mycobacterium sherrisii TaxID=243061 RepID=A0A1E3SZP3_9MYCO|nr:hypothetical protein [Mycobacterium sherrisii]MCV7032196.1 hypothetical protein [Mycobacterium sherrisii]MEC4764899.1 hypothetical protein [Mycobacterium sherrisii]ODR07696.1 hypothetical protein BHQ21_08175 [Mycobacterium sherrisii]ORW72487.1 hypothetical protein AWC25_19175 [Mycobacterium sherrisii]